LARRGERRGWGEVFFIQRKLSGKKIEVVRFVWCERVNTYALAIV